jgi:hypothetical protein
MAQHEDEIARRTLKRQEGWRKADEKELANAIVAMLDHKETRRYIYWLLEITHSIHQNPYRGNFGDTAFACGEQNIGQRVLAHLVECAPEGYLTLLKERADERRTREADLAGIQSGNPDRDHNAGDGFPEN